MAELFTLDNGLRVVVEYMPHLHSASTGLWIDVGSCAEQAGEYGLTHLLEHMMFKGTAKRSAQQIAAAMDNVGGMLNAFTTKEQTCYYTRCLDEQFELSLELLADMYHNSLFDAEETEREKQVVIEEINMYEDSPDDLVMEKLSAALWPHHPYGRSISGSVEQVAALDAAQVRAYWQRHYHATDTVLTVAGSIQPQRVLELASSYLSPGRGPHRQGAQLPLSQAGTSFTAKDIEQLHVCFGFPALSLADPDYYAASIVNSAFGGSSSARLFQEVREKRGLAYSPYSYLDVFSQGGLFTAYASTQPERARELLTVIGQQFSELAEHGLTEDELERSRQQLKGSLLLSMESSGQVMTKLGRSLLTLNKLYNPEEVVQRLMDVTLSDVRRAIDRIVQPDKAVLAQVGTDECAVTPEELLS